MPGTTPSVEEMSRLILIATNNRHKIQEIMTVLGTQHSYLGLADLPKVPEIVEDGRTFEENAAKKVLALAGCLVRNRAVIQLPVETKPILIADDSGLEVDALGGAPGVFSARFAATETAWPGLTIDERNNRKLLQLMASVPEHARTARFVCVIAAMLFDVDVGLSRVIDPAGIVYFRGVCRGRIGFEPRGTNGFGYDPLFIPDGYAMTFAEMPLAEKNKVSHRAIALAQLKNWFCGLSD